MVNKRVGAFNILNLKQELILSGLASLIGEGNGLCVNMPVDKLNSTARHGSFLVNVKSNEVKIYTTFINLPTYCVFRVVYVNRFNFGWAKPIRILPSPSPDLPPDIPSCMTRGLLSFIDSFRIYEAAFCCLIKDTDKLVFDVSFDKDKPYLIPGKHYLFKMDGKIKIIYSDKTQISNQPKTTWIKNETI